MTKNEQQNMTQDMFNEMRYLLGSGYVKEYYLSAMRPFLDIALCYVEAAEKANPVHKKLALSGAKHPNDERSAEV